MAPSQRHFGIPLDEYGNPISMAPHLGSPLDLSTPQYHLPTFDSPTHRGSSISSSISSSQIAHSPPEIQMSGVSTFVHSQHPSQLSPLSPTHQFTHGPDPDHFQTHQYRQIPHRPARGSRHENTPQYYNALNIETTPDTAQQIVHPNPMGGYLPHHQASEIPDKGPKFENGTHFARNNGTSWVGSENGHSHGRTINRQFSG
jgi:hypothetical protein